MANIVFLLFKKQWYKFLSMCIKTKTWPNLEKKRCSTSWGLCGFQLVATRPHSALSQSLLSQTAHTWRGLWLLALMGQGKLLGKGFSKKDLCQGERTCVTKARDSPAALVPFISFLFSMNFFLLGSFPFEISVGCGPVKAGCQSLMQGCVRIAVSMGF